MPSCNKNIEIYFQVAILYYIEAHNHKMYGDNGKYNYADLVFCWPVRVYAFKEVNGELVSCAGLSRSSYPSAAVCHLK